MPKKKGVDMAVAGACVDIHFDTRLYCVEGFRCKDAAELVSQSRDVRLETKDLEIGKVTVVANAMTATQSEIVHAVQHVLDCLVEVA